MTNLCLVVIAAQFSETRQRESALIEQANRKARLLKSYSTLSGSVSSYTLKDQGCYAAILGIIEDTCKRLQKRIGEKFAGTRCCQVKEKRKTMRRVVKKKEKKSTIHLHHHHHHHFHHHHHICSNDNSKSLNEEDSLSSPRIFHPATDTSHPSSLRTPTIVAIDNEFRDPRVGVASVCPLAIKSTTLLMPDTTVLICRQPSPRSPQPTHTVSFYSTSLNDKSGFSDDIPLRSKETSYDIPSKRINTGNCPNVQELEAGVHCGGYEEIIRSNSSDDDDDEEEEEEEEVDEDEMPGCCSRLRIKMRDICESNAFKGIIMAAILLNTITMGIEHHGQVSPFEFSILLIGLLFLPYHLCFTFITFLLSSSYLLYLAFFTYLLHLTSFILLSSLTFFTYLLHLPSSLTFFTYLLHLPSSLAFFIYLLHLIFTPHLLHLTFFI